jgi:hypothetical protein
MHCAARVGGSARSPGIGVEPQASTAYLPGRQGGVRTPNLLDLFEVFAPSCTQRVADDPHLWASTLFDDLVDLGCGRSLSHDDRRCGSGRGARRVSVAGPRRAAQSR